MRRMSCRMVAGLCFWAVVSPPAHGDEATKQVPPPATLSALDARLAESFRNAGIPGAMVAIIEGGQVILAKGYGFEDVAAKKPATADSVFRAGSISKSLTGIAAMTLVEQGKLSLDGKLADLAPEVSFENRWESTDSRVFRCATAR